LKPVTELEINSVVKKFGGLIALNNVSFEVKSGEILGLIGPNGAGKTTLINCISGFYRPEAGKILYKGRNIIGLKPYQICQLGIGRTFQIVETFPTLTVLENVMVGAIFSGSFSNLNEAKLKSREILEHINFPRDENVLAKYLNLGEMKLLSLARVLVTNPKLLLLDEIIAGLTPIEEAKIIEVLKEVHEKQKVTIVLVEHVMRVVMKLCNRIVVLHEGKKIAEGKPEEIAQNEKVIEAYLGEEYLKI
jgi:branched-chain amino acid transport system ATP-binding protein